MWFNPIMKGTLRSPLHFLISKSTMLVTYTGRKSGRVYTTPVSYLQVGDQLYTISSPDRVWWRNLREGAEVTLHLRGSDVRARGEVIEDQPLVEEALARYLESAPERAKYLKIALDADGTPDKQDLRRLAEHKVMVEMRLATAANSQINTA